MAKSEAHKRDKLFSLYADNLKQFKPELKDNFLCPICQRAFDCTALEGKDPEISLAHIIPESLGGRLTTITCKKCNNNVGSKYDVHVQLEEEYHAWLNGESRDYAHLSNGNTRIPVYCKLGYDREESMPSLSFWPVNLSEPKYYEFIEAAKKDWANMHLSLDTKGYFNPRKRDISIIHSGFLLMFQQFGYEYVISPNAQLIRKTIQGDSDFDLAKIIISTHSGIPFPNPLPQIGILINSPDVYSFIVALPFLQKGNQARLVLLPGFGKEGLDAYNRLLKSNEPIGASKINGIWFDFKEQLLQKLGSSNTKGICEYLWDLYTKPNDREKIIYRHYPNFFAEFSDEEIIYRPSPK